MASDKHFRDFTEKRVNEISLLFERIERALKDAVEETIDQDISSESKTRAQQTIAEILADANDATAEYIDRVIPEAYQEGIDFANDVIKTGAGKALDASHALQVEALVDEAHMDFGVGLAGAQKAANTMLNEAISLQVTSRIAQGVIDGEGVPDLKKEVLAILKDRGFITFISSNQRNYSLKWYAEMLVRTHIIRSANEGTVKRANELGITMFEFSDHANECPLCRPHEGKIYDSTGKRKPKPPSMPIHPNCRHVLLPRPDL